LAGGADEAARWHLGGGDAADSGWKNPNGWILEQKISVAEAVHAYTMGSAYAEFEEKIKGSIEKGKLADLVVLDTDIFHADAAQLKSARVDLTMLGGKVVFDRAQPAK
jgi:hypothetical protein